MSDYKVIRELSQSSLESEIKRRIRDGWKLVGGVSQENVGYYIQAITK